MAQKHPKTAIVKTPEPTQEQTPQPETVQRAQAVVFSPPAGIGGNPQAQGALLQRQTDGHLHRAGPALLQMQRAYGNQYVQQVVQAARASAPQSGGVIQTKSLTLGPVDDQYEREADRVAQQVVSQTRNSGAPQTDGAPDIGQVQMSSLGSPSAATNAPIDAGVQVGIERVRGGGHALDGAVRGQMEQAFGADFGGVRVHTDGQADQLNQALQARAFTTGQDIFFRRGEYRPGSGAGRQLLAHELTHVVQQERWKPDTPAPVQRLTALDMARLSEEEIATFTSPGFIQWLWQKLDGRSERVPDNNALKALVNRYISGETYQTVASYLSTYKKELFPLDPRDIEEERTPGGTGGYGAIKKVKAKEEQLAIKEFRSDESYEKEKALVERLLGTSGHLNIIEYTGQTTNTRYYDEEFNEETYKRGIIYGGLEETLEKLREVGKGIGEDFKRYGFENWHIMEDYEEAIIGYTLDVVDGLMHLKQKGMADDTDLKPANIMTDKKGRAVIIDIGGVQLEGEEIKEWTGEYSTGKEIREVREEKKGTLDQAILGRMLYEWLTGHKMIDFKTGKYRTEDELLWYSARMISLKTLSEQLLKRDARTRFDAVKTTLTSLADPQMHRRAKEDISRMLRQGENR